MAIADAYPQGSPQDASTTDLLHQLREQVVPDAEEGSGVDVLVGGQTAIFDDFSTVLSDKLPLFIGVVVLISFLLLMAVFRSLLIPAIAAVDEPARRRGVVRRDHRRLPVGLGRGACSASTRPGRSRRSCR